VSLTHLSSQNAANGRLFGRAPGGGRGAAPKAAKAAVSNLQRYLNGAFVDKRTRLSRRPVNELLTRKARRELTPASRVALGDGLRMQGGRTGRASASALVLHKAGQVVSVTLRYTAAMRVVLAKGGNETWRQRGTVLLLRERGRWRADMVDVELVRR